MNIQLETTRRILEAAKGGVDFLWLGEDLGTQKSPIISLNVFRRHIRPRYQKFCDLAKAYNAFVMIHTCGSSSWAYEDFIEMGMRAVDTLQPEAKDMSPSHLKQKFGGRLAFHGCISTAGCGLWICSRRGGLLLNTPDHDVGGVLFHAPVAGQQPDRKCGCHETAAKFGIYRRWF